MPAALRAKHRALRARHSGRGARGQVLRSRWHGLGPATQERYSRSGTRDGGRCSDASYTPRLSALSASPAICFLMARDLVSLRSGTSRPTPANRQGPATGPKQPSPVYSWRPFRSPNRPLSTQCWLEGAPELELNRHCIQERAFNAVERIAVDPPGRCSLLNMLRDL